MKEEFQAWMLCIHFGEDDTWHGRPLYEAIVSKCGDIGIANATVFRGIEGFGASTIIHRSKIWSLSKDAPITIDIVDREDSIDKLLPLLDEMVVEGLVAMSQVRVTRYFQAPAEPAPAAQ